MPSSRLSKRWLKINLEALLRHYTMTREANTCPMSGRLFVMMQASGDSIPSALNLIRTVLLNVLIAL